MMYKEFDRRGMQFFPDLDNNIISDWLYGDWNEEKYRSYLAARSLDPSGLVGGYFDYLLDRRADQEYFRRYGMSYSDIHDPRRLRQSSSTEQLYRSSVNFISSNVKRLYH